MDITNSIAILTKKIESLEALICANSKKELMTLEDVVAYTGYRRSSLLTLVCHRELKSISVAQADKFRCCGVCANYRYEVAAKGHCKWPSYNASQMRPACKRFKRVNDKTELYNNYSAKGVNIK